MRIIISTNACHQRPGGAKAALVQNLYWCGQAGCRYLEVDFGAYTRCASPFVTNEYDGWLARAREIAKEYDMSFVLGRAPYDSDYADRAFFEKMALRSIDAAAYQGMQELIFRTGARDIGEAAARLRPLVSHAREKGIGISVGNTLQPGAYTYEIEGLLELADVLGSEQVGTHWTCGNGPAEQLKTLGSRLRSVELPWDEKTEPYLAALRESGFTGNLIPDLRGITENTQDARLPEQLRRALVEAEKYG